jgi:copper chaperone NosL
MNNQLSIVSRILVAFASGALMVVFFLPAWRIDLFAPQYPEGLTMNIWINGLSGDVDVINGLNHYIGMKHITVAMFPEFRFLPYVVAFFMLLGMMVAITGSRKFLFLYLLLTVLGGLLVMYDFYQWGYDYGHNLDPKAPIQVPGLSYQPPLIGHKRLLNFDAYSLPGVGGWIVMAAGTLAFMVWFAEWYRHRRKKQGQPALVIVILALMTSLGSCSPASPEPFQAGKDICQFCKMGINDTRYGGELVTKKGRIYKFDDLKCMVSYLHAKLINENDLAQSWVVDFNKPNTFLPARNTSFLTGRVLKSPMNGNTAGFKTKEAAAIVAKLDKASVITDWESVLNSLK